MNSQNNWTFDELDTYVEKQLKSSVTRVEPAAGLRQRILGAAQWASTVGGGEDQVKSEVAEKDRSGDYRELHHRLIGRGLFYHAPLGTQAGFMIT